MPNYLYLGGMAAAIACTPYGAACAQNDPAQAEIVVTGSKLDGAPQKSPRSVQVIDEATLKASGVRGIADLAKVVPGFTYTLSAYGAPVFTLRGIGFYDVSLTAPPAVSVYTDEAPLPYSGLTIGAGLDLATVQIAKGPQGTLFGQNSTGGAINYVSAKPTPTFSAGLQTGVNNFGLVSSEGFISGPVAPNVGMRLAVRYDKGGDWQKSDTRNDSRGAKDLMVARLLTKWTPAPNLDVLLNLNGWRDRSDSQAGQLLAIISKSTSLPPALYTHPIGVLGAREADWTPGRPFRRDSDFFQSSLRIDYRLPSVTLTSISSYLHFRRNDGVDSDGTQFQLFDVQTPGRMAILSQELRAAARIGALKWTAGGNYQHERDRDGFEILFPVSSYPFDGVTTRTRQRNQSWALFSTAEYPLTSTLSLEGGGRYTDEVRHFTGCTYDDGDGTGAAYVSRVATALSGTKVVIPAGGCATLSDRFLPGPYSGTLKDRNWSWRGGLKWTPASNLMLYANASRGQKSGAFPTLGATAASQFKPARPESVLAYETGIKFNTTDNLLRVTAAGFYYDYHDKQTRGRTLDPRLGPLGTLVNIPKSHVWGAEAEINLRPSRTLLLTAGASYTLSKIDGPFVAYDGFGRLRDLSGEHFPLTPKWHLVASAEYRRPVGGDRTVFVGTNVMYQSMSNSDLGNIRQLQVPGYTLVDLRGGIEIGPRWTAEAYVRNVANKNYAIFINSNPPDVLVRLAGMPRTVGVRFSYRI